jgi:hypothetical protein
MARGESAEYQAKLLEDNGVIRGRIPAPLIRDLGGRPGDFLVFKTDGSGSVQLSIQRARGGGSKVGRTTTARKSTTSKTASKSARRRT